ncbi:MAG: hypothetical protein JXQ26_09805 [Tissierellales bacterium]|jgi:sulfur relay (sulfurtransferase) complex TusBCD TusD component (DsrE family)|nr:hypothetical protein [Tissierellales bacterium]
MDARGLSEEMIIEGAERSSLAELSMMVEEADKILVY